MIVTVVGDLDPRVNMYRRFRGNFCRRKNETEGGRKSPHTRISVSRRTKRGEADALVNTYLHNSKYTLRLMKITNYCRESCIILYGDELYTFLNMSIINSVSKSLVSQLVKKLPTFCVTR
jgi:hypothetical protein